MTETISLGKTEINISPIGMGAWQWGDRFFWRSGTKYTDDDVRTAFLASVEAGVNWVDTAELYGPGTSEQMLGRFIRETGKKVFVASKCYPFPWRWSGKALRGALRGSLRRLGLPQIDLYQMHWPYGPVPVEGWMEAMAEAAKEGLIRAIGVSNYSAEQTRRAADQLAKHGLSLASNQIEYNLLERTPESNGTIAACSELGVTVIAYSPIAKGMLSGKYTPETMPPTVRRGWYDRDFVGRAQPLLHLMREIGQAHGHKSSSQVALNWLMCKGAVAIPGAKNVKQAVENAGSMGWRLNEAEVLALDGASAKVANSKS
jgi:aryl-alcohol dehydrogenase-like predicted oxidoreductase